MKKVLALAAGFVAAALPSISSAAGLFDATGVTIDTSSLSDVAALTVPVLFGLLVLRKIVKSTNRT